MRDYAKRNSSSKNNISANKTIFRSKKKNISVVSRASSSLQPHLIIFYLKDFAHCFHSFYNDNQVLTESKENIEAIIFCLNAAKTILSNGLALLGIKPIEKM